MTLLLAMVLGLGTGCSEEREIVRHRIPKSRSGLEKLRESQAGMSSPEAKQESTRMAVAIFENPDATWFVKIVGPTKQVNETESQWQRFFETVRFEAGNPVWDLPAGWSVAGPKPMRFETLVIGDYTPPLEVAISSLGPNQDLLLNVNRWRVQQLGLAPATADDLDSMLQKQKTESREYLVFDTVGFGSGKMTPPFAGGAPFAGASAGPPPMVQEQPSASPAPKLTFDTPSGWTAGQASSIVHARLKKIANDTEAQITIIELPPNNEWVPNVERWAGEVGLAGLSEEQFADRTSEITVDGVKGKLVDLVDLDSESEIATIAGMFQHDGSAWFLKLTGDKRIVDDSRDLFKQFIASIRLQ